MRALCSAHEPSQHTILRFPPFRIQRPESASPRGDRSRPLDGNHRPASFTGALCSDSYRIRLTSLLQKSYDVRDAFLASSASIAVALATASPALAKDGAYGILEGRTAALVHPAVMGVLFLRYVLTRHRSQGDGWPDSALRPPFQPSMPHYMMPRGCLVLPLTLYFLPPAAQSTSAQDSGRSFATSPPLSALFLAPPH